jgi:hypothetical protein
MLVSLILANLPSIKLYLQSLVTHSMPYKRERLTGVFWNGRVSPMLSSDQCLSEISFENLPSCDQCCCEISFRSLPSWNECLCRSLFENLQCWSEPKMEHWAYSHWLWKYSLRLNVSSLHLLFEEALLAISFYTLGSWCMAIMVCFPCVWCYDQIWGRQHCLFGFHLTLIYENLTKLLIESPLERSLFRTVR